jgi:hypothetical protein
MHGRNVKSTALRNAAQRIRAHIGTVAAARASCLRKSQSDRRKTKTKLFQRRKPFSLHRVPAYGTKPRLLRRGFTFLRTGSLVESGQGPFDNAVKRRDSCRL